MFSDVCAVARRAESELQYYRCEKKTHIFVQGGISLEPEMSSGYVTAKRKKKDRKEEDALKP